MRSTAPLLAFLIAIVVIAFLELSQPKNEPDAGHAPLGPPAIPADFATEPARLLRGAWPRVEEACPGFYRFGGDVAHAGVRAGWNGDPHAVEFDLVVSDRPADARLWQLHAEGHQCAFGLTGDPGARLVTTKPACLALCTDRVEGYRSDARYEVGLRPSASATP